MVDTAGVEVRRPACKDRLLERPHGLSHPRRHGRHHAASARWCASISMCRWPMAAGDGRHPHPCAAAMPTVNELSDKGAKVLVLAHFGRPKGQPSAECRFSHGCRAVRRSVGREHVRAISIGKAMPQPWQRCRSSPGDIAVLENTASSAARKRMIPPWRDRLRRWRSLCERRLFCRAPCPCLHRRAGAQASRLCWPFDGKAELEALQAALGNPGQAGCGRRRRSEGFVQARCAQQPHRRSIISSSAAAWPTPSSLRAGLMSASRCASMISPIPLRILMPRRCRWMHGPSAL
jgi:hypothetical protein